MVGGGGNSLHKVMGGRRRLFSPLSCGWGKEVIHSEEEVIHTEEEVIHLEEEVINTWRYKWQPKSKKLWIWVFGLTTWIGTWNLDKNLSKNWMCLIWRHIFPEYMMFYSSRPMWLALDLSRVRTKWSLHVLIFSFFLKIFTSLSDVHLWLGHFHFLQYFQMTEV